MLYRVDNKTFQIRNLYWKQFQLLIKLRCFRLLKINEFHINKDIQLWNIKNKIIVLNTNLV